MVKIIMTATKLGSNDGATVREYVKGQEYDVSTALAREFIASGAAEEPHQQAAEDADDGMDGAEGDTGQDNAEDSVDGGVLEERLDNAEAGEQIAPGVQGDGTDTPRVKTSRKG
jgi:hypothetical protein